MRNLKLLALIPVVIALLAVVKLYFAGPVTLVGVGYALLGALAEMIIIPSMLYFLAQSDTERRP